MTERKNSPVFVVGCHRSGTALLYDTLLSAGGFALYHGVPFVHTSLLPKCGNPAVPGNRDKILQTWLRSKPFRRTGLEVDYFRSRMQEWRTGGDFLRITLGEVARRQGAQRWAAYDPDNIMHIPTVKREVPDALFVHVVRDGRDAALSLRKQHRDLALLPWDRNRTLFGWALNWQWTVRKGRRYGQMFPRDYIEVRYEELVEEPEKTLRNLGGFLEHDFDYGRIQNAGIGRVGSPNTVWKEESKGETFSPVNRWKTKLPQPEIAALEALIGDCLEEFGYSLSTRSSRLDPRVRLMSVIYPTYFETKLFLKSKTVLGRLIRAERLELTNPA